MGYIWPIYGGPIVWEFSVSYLPNASHNCRVVQQAAAPAGGYVIPPFTPGPPPRPPRDEPVQAPENGDFKTTTLFSGAWTPAGSRLGDRGNAGEHAYFRQPNPRIIDGVLRHPEAAQLHQGPYDENGGVVQCYHDPDLPTVAPFYSDHWSSFSDSDLFEINMQAAVGLLTTRFPEIEFFTVLVTTKHRGEGFLTQCSQPGSPHIITQFKDAGLFYVNQAALADNEDIGDVQMDVAHAPLGASVFAGVPHVPTLWQRYNATTETWESADADHWATETEDHSYSTANADVDVVGDGYLDYLSFCYVLRPSAHSWEGQQVANQANRMLWTGAEIGLVAHEINGTWGRLHQRALGQEDPLIEGGVRVALNGWYRIYTPSVDALQYIVGSA